MKRNKIIQFTLILFGCFSLTFAQGDWELLIPSPTSNQMVGLYFIDAQTGWSVGEYGTILKSTDGGETWSIQEIPWTFDLSDVYFPTENIGYAVGTDGFIIKSTDGGDSWSQLNNQYVNNINRVLFKDENTGWLICEKGLILFTDNGGGHWQLQSSGINENLRGIDFIGPDTLCIVGENETILLLDAIKANWSDVSFSINDYFAPYSFEDVYFADNRNGWICGYGKEDHGVLLFTANGGLSWEKQVLISGDYKSWTMSLSGGFNLPLQQVYFYDDLKTGIILTKEDSWGYGNLLYRSTTKGSSWKGNSEGTSPSFDGDGRFCVLSEERVVKTGYQGDFSYSENKGYSCVLLNHDKRWWSKIIIGTKGKLLAFQDYRNGGHNWNFYRSENYGNSFEQYIPQIYDSSGMELTLDHFLDIEANYPGSYLIDQDTLWCCFRDKSKIESILYSIDFGKSFYETQCIAEPKVSIGRTRFLTRDFLIRYYFDGETSLRFESSIDGGTTFLHSDSRDVWNKITEDNAARNHCFIDTQTGFLVGGDGNIIKTTDGGNTWTNIYSGVVENLRDIVFVNATTGFVVGDFGRILKTDDHGETWRKTNSGTQENIYCISFINEEEGWVGTENGLRYTKDGGENWQGVPLRYNHSRIQEIQFAGEEGWAYSLPSIPDTYVHLFYLKNGSTDIKKIDIQFKHLSEISLSPNYPNPFNSTTLINYNLPQSGDVLLRIFNIQGQLVRTLVNRTEESGSHSAIWNGHSDAGSLVGSGVYIYQLEFGNQVKNQKLLFIK